MFFFRGIFSYVTVLCTCYLKLLKDCVDVPFNKRPCAHPESDACLKISSVEMGCFCFVRPHSCKITCSSSPAGARPSHPPLCDSYIAWLGVDRHAIPNRPRVTPSAEFKSNKRAANFWHHAVLMCFEHPSYLHHSNQTTHLSLSACSRLLFLPSEKLRKQISASNRFHYSCDTWPITIETALIKYQTNTCADIRRIIHNVNIIRLL